MVMPPKRIPSAITANPPNRTKSFHPSDRSGSGIPDAKSAAPDSEMAAEAAIFHRST
jgi:hypothetical protein